MADAWQCRLGAYWRLRSRRYTNTASDPIPTAANRVTNVIRSRVVVATTSMVPRTRGAMASGMSTVVRVSLCRASRGWLAAPPTLSSTVVSWSASISGVGVGTMVGVGTKGVCVLVGIGSSVGLGMRVGMEVDVAVGIGV